jgi:hypothetical protein
MGIPAFSSQCRPKGLLVNGCNYGGRDGNNTLFWQDRWINGKSINDLAPLIFTLISTRVADKRTVHEALNNMKWVLDIQQVRCSLSTSF